MATSKSKKLYLAGSFDNTVTIKSALAQGTNCTASGADSFAGGNNSSAVRANSFAFGNTTIASGNNSIALGKQSTAGHERSFVWNGQSTETLASSAEGQFIIYPKDGIDGFFIGGKSLNELIPKQQSVDGEEHSWTKTNSFEGTVCFNNTVSLGNNSTLSSQNGSKVKLENSIVTFHTPSETEAETNTKLGATVGYIQDKINNFLAKANTWTGVQTFTQVIQGVALKAQWADLAEYYEADRAYEPGTLVKFGGDKEITAASLGKVNAVVSTRPGLILGEKKSSDWLFIALCGRVPVKVCGTCKKFDRLYLSEEFDGCASAIEPYAGCKPIGIALADKTETKAGNVLSVVKLSI